MGPHKLFQAIVVVGAALTGGCGGSDTPAADAPVLVADAGIAPDAGVPDAGTPADAEVDGMVLIL